MSLIDVLAVVGAVSGISGALLGAASYRRDRSRLLVRHHDVGTPTKDGYKHFVRIYVVNAGRQPVAITEVGLSTRERSRIRRLLRRFSHELTLLRRGMAVEFGQSWPALDEEEDPAVLQPGDLKKFILLEIEGPPLSDMRMPIYAFATDALAHTSWDRSKVFPYHKAGWARTDREPETFYG